MASHAQESTEGPVQLPWGWQRAKRHVKDIFHPTHGWYYNDAGEHVYGPVERRKLVNPLTICAMLTWKNWIFFLVGLWAWTCAPSLLIERYRC